jgi:hypothetical protein
MKRLGEVSPELRKLGLALGSIAIGSVCAYFSTLSVAKLVRAPSSASIGEELVEAPLDSRNDYAKLPCADEEGMKRYMKLLKVRSAPKGQICGDGSDYEKLGKLLRFMDESKIAATEVPNYGGFVAAKSPLKYIAGLVDSVNFDGFTVDSTQSDGIAAFNSNGDVFVGPRVLTFPPIDGASVMVHEARHSHAEDPSHTLCQRGELVGQKDACDDTYSTHSDMGAYAVSAQYLMAVAAGGANFSVSDREYARARGVAYLDNRFNNLPADNPSIDVLLTLDNHGRVRLFHPVVRLPMEPRENSPALAQGDRLSQLLEPTLGRLCGISSEGQLRCGKRVNDYTNPFAEVEGSNPQKVRDYRALLAGQVIPYVLGEDNVLSTLKLNPQNGKHSFKESSYRPKQTLKRLLGALGNERMVLSQEGALYPFPDRVEDFTLKSVAADPGAKGYLDAMGGPLSADLWMIQNETGRLLYWNQREGQVSESIMQCPDGAIQYSEGSVLRMLLCKDGSLVVKSYRDQKVSQYLPPMEVGSRIVSIGILPHFWAGPAGFPKADRRAKEFSELCGVASPQYDFWTDGWMGLDEEGQFVATGPKEMTCRQSQHPELAGRPIASIKFNSGENKDSVRGVVVMGADVVFRDGSKTRVEFYR